MKIAGVRGGKQRGEIIELAPEAKVYHAIQDAVAVDGIGYKPFDGFLVGVDKASVVVDKLESQPNGEPLKGKWQHNNYSVEGKAVLNLRHIESNTARLPKTMKFRLKFRDALDLNGMPDLKVESIKLN